MNRSTFVRRGLALLLLAASLAGCSQNPTAPSVEPSALGRSSLSLIIDEPGAPAAPPEASTVQGAYSTKLVTPGRGGRVSAGRFTVIIPRGALRRAAFVTVKHVDLTKSEVELEVRPAAANNFRVPVLLVADCASMDASLIPTQTIYGWNPDASRWDAGVGVQVDLVGQSVSMPLWHFSKYKLDGVDSW